MSLPKVHFQTVGSDISLVTTLHWTHISGFFPSRPYAVLGLEVTSHIADSMHAGQYRPTIVRTRDHVLSTTTC